MLRKITIALSAAFVLGLGAVSTASAQYDLYIVTTDVYGAAHQDGFQAFAQSRATGAFASAPAPRGFIPGDARYDASAW